MADLPEDFCVLMAAFNVSPDDPDAYRKYLEVRQMLYGHEAVMPDL